MKTKALLWPRRQVIDSILPISVGLAVTLVFASPAALSAEAIVIKSKGRQAIVQFSGDYAPKTGQRIEVGPLSESSSRMSNDADSNNRRRHLIALSANLSSLSVASTSGSNTSTTSSTNIGLTGQFGWNLETIELGPLLSLSYRGSGSAGTTTFSGGAFLDYDLLPNVPTADVVAGFGGQLFAGRSSSSGGNLSSSFGVLGGGQLKWFCLSHQAALRLDALADYERGSGTITTTQTGFLFKGGIQYYF